MCPCGDGADVGRNEPRLGQKRCHLHRYSTGRGRPSGSAPMINRSPGCNTDKDAQHGFDAARHFGRQFIANDARLVESTGSIRSVLGYRTKRIVHQSQVRTMALEYRWIDAWPTGSGGTRTFPSCQSCEPACPPQRNVPMIWSYVGATSSAVPQAARAAPRDSATILRALCPLLHYSLGACLLLLLVQARLGPSAKAAAPACSPWLRPLGMAEQKRIPPRPRGPDLLLGSGS